MRANLSTTVATYGILSLAGGLAFVMPESVAVDSCPTPAPAAAVTPAPAVAAATREEGLQVSVAGFRPEDELPGTGS